MVHELGEEGVGQWAEGVVARAAGADENILVEKGVQMRVEPSPEVLRREDVAGRHEQLLARRHVIGARSKQVHDGLRDGLLVRLDRLGVTPEQVRHERHHLHLRTLQISERGAKVRRDVVRARALKPDRLDHERE